MSSMMDLKAQYRPNNDYALPVVLTRGHGASAPDDTQIREVVDEVNKVWLAS